MPTSLRVLRTATGALLALACWGCGTARIVTIEIPDFDSNSIQGVWIWRHSEESGQFERAAEIRIERRDRVRRADGAELEYVIYSIPEDDGDRRLDLPARVIRNPARPDTAEISFLFFPFSKGGRFRASTYNQAGESPLSSQVLEISSS